ncbi:MAG: hypothetical protein IJT78_02435 [Oscillospiraceae bacterium]|nr:hypothetical protein [Oscillospiraceae bacterium]
MIRVKVKNNAVNVTSRSAVLIPSRTSELENDSDFQSAAQVSAAVGAEAALRARADAAAEAEISAAFVKRVAAGELAVFDDGADNVPVAELAVELPYQSGGYTGCTVTRGGKNLLDETAFRAYANWRDDLYPEATTEHYYTTNNNRGFLLALPAGLTYTVSFSVSGSAVPKYFYLCAHNGSDGRLLATFTDTVLRRSAYTFTAEEGTQYYLRMGANATESLFAANMACIDWVQIEAGGRQTGYAPYDTRTYSADWTHLTGGVYGGTWDVTSGVLTSTLDENGDALAQPVTYDLDPIAVKTRLGNNSVWSDAGGVSVTYRADPNMVIYHSTAGGLTSWKMLQDMVRLGRAKEVLSVGDQLVCRRNGVDLVWDVLGIDCDTPADSQLTHSVTLGLHDCFSDLQFDTREALFYFADGLAAGTYNFTVKAHSWVSGDVNKTFQFTLTQAIPAKGQLVLQVAYNVTIAGSTAKTYSSSTSTTEIETVTITEGSGGTSLGDVNNAISGGTNSLQRALLGNNNYSQSAMRQYLNSRAAAGSVWTPKNVWDRAPSWATTTAGFLNGMDEDFLSVIGEVTKKTAFNSETTTEKFFLLSRSEVYAGNEVTGGEGAAYPYYSDYSDLGSAGTDNDSNRIKYRNGTAKYWWLRSPDASYASQVRRVSTTGSIIGNSTGAGNSSGVAPACCIV